MSKKFGKIIRKKIIAIAIVVLIVCVVIVGYFWKNNVGGCSIDETNKEEFAKYLTEKGIKMYGSAFCGYCKKQKELFGEAFKYIDYTECTENRELCKDLVGVPAWKINGEIYYGTKTLSELKALVGC
ncbi:MAG: hypothetical protein N3D20_01190 [Candidatus Pacearchaeota archaeon]|nr:hypothetical protein [Candidatus Pacearchaeota archaeon]